MKFQKIWGGKYSHKKCITLRVHYTESSPWRGGENDRDLTI